MEETMAGGEELGSRLLKIVQQTPDCDVDSLAAHCPDMTWNQVFLALDQLSRSGQVILKQQGPGHYNVTALPEKPLHQSHVIHRS
ncbi:hypothetical protein ACO9S2_14410 [Nitrospira sp. NS4]|uniref:hypothetical protein n=1 Tax=Nitrospira sp. NS4 TaxID=3414498 RepID=UPI003C2EFF8D